MARVMVRRDGKVEEIGLDDWIAAGRPGDFVWVHIDGREETARDAIARTDHLPEGAINALTALETRPRCTFIGQGALVNLRGLGEMQPGDSDHLVSIRLWAERRLIVSVVFRRPDALAPVRDGVANGAVTDPGDFIAALASEITETMNPDVAALGDCVDEVESAVEAEDAAAARRIVASVRARAIAYRRFVVPQRQALEKLSLAQVDWLEADDHVHLQEAADRCARMAEELEAIRERAALAHEELTDLRAEQMNRQALILAVVALLFLPLTFITGLLGMNVDGIPFAHHPWAFWGVTGLCIVVAAAIAAWFGLTRWLR